MKKFRIIGISVLVVMILASCASIRGDIVAISKEDLKNAETSRTVAKNFLKVWALNRGFIDGVFYKQEGQIPGDTLATMDQLNMRAKERGYWDQEDYDLGYSLGLKEKALNSVIRELIKMYAPSIMDYLPALLKI